MEPGWLEAHLDRTDGLPRVDWNAVLQRIRRDVPAEDRDAACRAAAREWLGATRETLGGSYRVDESPNFLLLAAFPPKAARDLLEFVERTRHRVLTELLPGIAAAPGRGRHVAIVLDDIEAYYSYIAYFYPSEGEFAASGGLFVERPYGHRGAGYGHFVVHAREVRHAERVVAHELTHNVLRHLRIPAWLNEGLATTVEAVVMGDAAFVVSKEDLDDHRCHWSDGVIQEFWSGAAVHRPDDGSRLTYDLARMAVRALSHDYPRFRSFVVSADARDAGEAAAVQTYGCGLGGLIERFLGPGDWAPQPDVWDEDPPSE